MRPSCIYCSKTEHLSEDCPVKLAAEEGYGSEEEAAISHSEGEEGSAEPEQSAAPQTAQPETVRAHAVRADNARQQLPAGQWPQLGRDTSYSPEVQASSQIKL